MARKTGEKGLKQEPVSFPCGELSLEGTYYLPEGTGAFPGVVLCHPHPLFGGSMDNNVIYSVTKALTEKSIAVLTFNFRGVGGSQGKYGGGLEEQDDVTSAIDYLSSRLDTDKGRVGLAGYSFGAMMALPVAIADKRVKALALISMPPGPEQISQLKDCFTPKLLISGTNDTVVPVEKARLMAREAGEPKETEIIQGADHIWWGYEEVLAEKVTEFLTQKL